MKTNRRFPLCTEEEIKFVQLTLSSLTVACCCYYPHNSNYVHHTIRGKAITNRFGNEQGKVVLTEREDDAIEKIFDIYFRTFTNHVDVLLYNVSLSKKDEFGSDLHYEHPLALPKLKATLAGRPLQVTLLIEDDCLRPDSPTPKFLREYADYTMFICRACNEKIELSDKMINCEFLGLKCDVTNPERLKEFRGWGLALYDAEEKGFDFKFYCDVFENWYSGKTVQFHYLGLQCLTSANKEVWEQICARGQEKTYSNQIKVIEVTRADGTVARIKCMEDNRNKKKYNKFIFYLGERTLEVDDFNLDFMPSETIIAK